MMNADFDNCPFCGDKSVTLVYNQYSDTFDFACPNCHANVRFGYGSASVHYGSKEHAKEEAIKLWNRRENHIANVGKKVR